MFNIGISRDGYSARRNTEDGPVEVWVEVYVILATSPRGDVWALEGAGGEDEAIVQGQLAALDHDPSSRPDAWAPCDPVYGSEAWDDDAERSLAAFEADCYGEPRRD